MLVDGKTGEISGKRVNQLGMISGGTGITPMFQIIQAVNEDPLDFTGLSLLSFYQSPSEMLLDELLVDIEKAGTLYHFPVVENPDEQWIHGDGKITPNLIENFMPPPENPDSLILVAGPPKMNKTVSKMLTELNYKPDQFHIL